MYVSVQSFTVSCASGTSGVSVSRTATAYSVISQRDANVKATGLAKMLAFAELACAFPDTPAQLIFYSVEKSGSADAEAGYVPETFTVTLPAGAVYSLVSQAEADAAAQTAAQVQAELKRDAEQLPIYYNSAQTYSQGCGAGFESYTATVTVAANTFSSESSKAQADADALQSAKDQVAVLLAGNCIPIFYSEAVSYTATCTVPGEVGDPVTVSYAAGYVTSNVSTADATATALAAATAAALALIVCTAGYYNTEQSYTATCEGTYGTNWLGADVTVTIPAGTFFNAVQATADATALAEATTRATEALICSWGGGLLP